MTTISYTGLGTSGNWADGHNWKGGVAPGVSDTALVLGTSDITANGAIAVNNIMLIGGGTDTFTGAVTTYGLGNCKGLMVCINSTVDFTPGSSLADGGVMLVGVNGVGGFDARGTAALATTIQSNSAAIGKQVAGVGTVTIDHASWTNIESVLVGDKGSGTLNVVNSGRVTIEGGFALGLNVGAVGHATVSSGSTLTVDGWASVGGHGSLAGGVGTLTVNASATFDAKHSVAVATGSSITLAGGTVSVGDLTGGLDVQAGGTVIGAGALTTRTGGWMKDDGVIESKGGTLTIGSPVGGTGSLKIDTGSTMAITGVTVDLPKISFAAASGTLSLAHGAAVMSEIDGFGTGNQITMAGIDKAVWSSVTDELTLSSAGKTVDRLHLGGSYTGDSFLVTQSGGVGVITLHPGS